MKRLLFAALLPLTLLFVACAPTTEESTEPEWMGGTAVVSGMTVQYTVKKDLKFNGASIDQWSEWTGSLCDIQVDQSRAFGSQRASLAKGLAMAVAYCLNLGPLNGKYGGKNGENVEGALAYEEAYADAYIAACGEKLEPLGWSPAHDGQCELPDPNSIVL